MSNGKLEFEKSEVERREIHAEERNKLDYLVGKFLALLAAGEKILVFKQNYPLPLATAQRILQAVSRHGACPLLYVTPAAAGERPGSVERLGERLFHGVIDRFAPYDQANNPSLDVWTEICSETLRLRDAQAAA